MTDSQLSFFFEASQPAKRTEKHSGKIALIALIGCAGLAGSLVLLPDFDPSHASAHTANTEIAASPELVSAQNIETPLSEAPPPAAQTEPTYQAEAEEELETREVRVRRGDTLSLILKRASMFSALPELLRLGADSKPLHRLHLGQVLELRHDGKQLMQLIVHTSPTETIHYSREADGRYTVERVVLPVDIRQRQVSGTITHSLSVDGAQAGLNPGVVDKLAKVFAWDIDFSVGLRRGDHFHLLWEEHWVEGKRVGDGDILAAEFVNRGERFRALWHTDETGRALYYTPEGKALRKQFLRSPVNYRRISSHFNPRRLHPVLKIVRPHRGTDYAAPTGTPVYATADGKVTFRARDGAYGRVIFIRHDSRYTTVYAHLSKYASGIKVGSHVKQGQTIGYVGSSGLSTGPHLHYELRENGVHRDPHKITKNMPAVESLTEVEKLRFLHENAAALKILDQMTNTAVNLADAQ